MSFLRRSIPALVFIALSGVFAAFVGLVLFGNSILDWSNEVRFSVLRVAGVGAFPMGVLVVALLLTLIFRREWLKKYNYWLSSALFVLAISGVLSFFRPFDGWLAWFNLYGIFTLGGEVGDMVIGSPSFFGGVRVAIVVLAAAAIALPAWSKVASVAIAAGAVFLYVTTFMGLKSLLFRGDLPKVDGDDGAQRSDNLGIPACRIGANSVPGEKTGAPRPRSPPAPTLRLYRPSTATVALPISPTPTRPQMAARGKKMTTTTATRPQHRARSAFSSRPVLTGTRLWIPPRQRQTGIGRVMETSMRSQPPR